MTDCVDLHGHCGRAVHSVHTWSISSIERDYISWMRARSQFLNIKITLDLLTAVKPKSKFPVSAKLKFPVSHLIITYFSKDGPFLVYWS